MAVGVDQGEVPRVQPAVADHLRRGRVVLVVALHDVRAPDDELPDLPAGKLPVGVVDDAGLEPRDGHADGAGLLLHVEPRDGADGRGLREAVALAEPHPELLLELGHVGRRHGRAAGDAELQGADVEGARPFLHEHAQEYARDGGDVGHSLGLDRLEDALDAEGVEHHDAGPDQHGVEHVGHGAEGVKEGDQAQGLVRLRRREQGLEQRGLGDEVAVGENGPQGPARQPRGVDHHGRVVLGRIGGCKLEGPCRQGLLHGHRPLVDLGQQQVPAGGEAVLDLLEAPGRLGRRDQDPGIAVVQEVLQLVGGGHDVERHGHGAELLAGEIADGEFGDIGEHQGDLVALADAEGLQAVGQGVDGPVHLVEPDPGILVDEGRVVLVGAAGVSEQFPKVHKAHGPPRILRANHITTDPTLQPKTSEKSAFRGFCAA
ncbi:MAG: hypothetical protein A4E73_02644 [Syntrophaceae bacterium PtaU1.Bin231]|nr:MAG: hypothetical protein A4E73_02644 [Syntrophaceae bacterium PtaU1.Bin231]